MFPGIPANRNLESEASMCDCLLPRLALWGNGRDLHLSITLGLDDL